MGSKNGPKVIIFIVILFVERHLWTSLKTSKESYLGPSPKWSIFEYVRSFQELCITV